MLQLDALRPDTRALFEVLDKLDLIGEFVLIGGTAMALHHAHRESEDLDFVYVPSTPGTSGARLPLRLTNLIVKRLQVRGHSVVSILDQIELDIAENEGHYLPESHQDWLVDGVKLTFFSGDTVDRKKPFRELPAISSKSIRLLTSESLFETKGRLLVQRATTRDLFDLWYFLQHEGKTIAQIVELATEERPYYTEDHVLRRLTPIKQAITDPGFKPIIAGAPKTFLELVEALAVHVDRYQQDVVVEVLREEQGPNFKL